MASGPNPFEATSQPFKGRGRLRTCAPTRSQVTTGAAAQRTQARCARTSRCSSRVRAVGPWTWLRLGLGLGLGLLTLTPTLTPTRQGRQGRGPGDCGRGEPGRARRAAGDEGAPAEGARLLGLLSEVQRLLLSGGGGSSGGALAASSTEQPGSELQSAPPHPETGAPLTQNTARPAARMHTVSTGHPHADDLDLHNERN